jgi:hypothetical protein
MNNVFLINIFFKKHFLKNVFKNKNLQSRVTHTSHESHVFCPPPQKKHFCVLAIGDAPWTRAADEYSFHELGRRVARMHPCSRSERYGKQ